MHTNDCAMSLLLLLLLLLLLNPLQTQRFANSYFENFRKIAPLLGARSRAVLPIRACLLVHCEAQNLYYPRHSVLMHLRSIWCPDLRCFWRPRLMPVFQGRDLLARALQQHFTTTGHLGK
jgi:hypothetical protein